MKVTKEDIDKASAALDADYATAKAAKAAAALAKVAVYNAALKFDKAYTKYIKLKEEFENESN